MVNVWFCGNTKVYFEKIRDSFPPGCVFHEFSYVSTECKAGLVLKSTIEDTTVFGHKNYFEFTNQSISVTEAEEFTGYLDQYLQGYNPEYREKHASNRLKAPETALLGPESFERFKAACIDRGYRDGQFKVNLLMQDEKRHSMFKEFVR
jgi:hypothetical protein